MTTLYHLRLDVRKVQDYIFQVPKLKYMLGANSKIGELFSKNLPALMPGEDCVFEDAQVQDLSADLAANFPKNILSSAGGHFEAILFSELGCCILESDKASGLWNRTSNINYDSCLTEKD